jgi:prepilin-type processing-associated H-X9-DG protein
MGPSCQYSWFDDKGLHSRYHGSGIELSLGSVAGASLGLSVMMPALVRARSQASRITSASNLKLIALSCRIYAEDNDGKFPPNLEDLIEKTNLSPKSLESALKPKGFDGPSYIYIAGQTTAMEPGNVVAYDNPAFMSEGVNVLFMDGHVQWMKLEAFLRELEATYKRLGREMPQIKFKGSKQPVPVEETKPVPSPQ